MNDRFKWIPDHYVLSQVSILAEKHDYNHDMMNIPAMWKTTMGKGIRVAIIDTGVPKHVDIDVTLGGSTIPGYMEDKNGHATHVAGTIAAIANNGMGIAGISPEVEDCYIAALDGSGGGSVSDIAKAIYMAVDDMQVHIINLSLGISAGAPMFPELEQACNYAVSQGVAIFAAAGNEYGAVGQPACYDSVITVAAVDSSMAHADFSNTGPEVDFAAGGVNVYSTYLNNTYAKLSGTSMACPALAGVGALILAKHKDQGEILTPQELREHLRRIAYDIGPGGFDEIHGHGIPIFGKMPDKPEPKLPPPSLLDEEKVKAMGPKADCAYWGLWKNFIGEVDKHINQGNGLEVAVRQGLKQLASHTSKVDTLIRKKNK